MVALVLGFAPTSPPNHSRFKLFAPEWIGENLAALANAKPTLSRVRRRLLAQVALKHLDPSDLINCLLGSVFPATAKSTQSDWETRIFIDQPSFFMRKECKILADGPGSVLHTPHESFDLKHMVTAIMSQAPTLMPFLRRLMFANRPSREEALSENRQRIKDTRAAFVVSQLLFSNSQKNNSFQTFLGVHFKFSGLPKNVCLASPWESIYVASSRWMCYPIVVSTQGISIAHDFGISCSNQTISDAFDRVTRAARKHAIAVAASQEPFIIVMDNVNVVARVSQAGGGHQNEMHCLTNFIGMQSTSKQAQAEFADAKAQPHEPPSSLDIEDEGLDRFVVTDDDEDILFDRICMFIARIAAPLFEEAARQKPIVPLRMQISPLPAESAPPRVSVFPVALMDQDENKVDEVITLGEELVHILQCDCDIKKAKHKADRGLNASNHDGDEGEDSDADGNSHDEDMLLTEGRDCNNCCAKRLENDLILIFGDGLTVRNLRKVCSFSHVRLYSSLRLTSFRMILQAIFLRMHVSGDYLKCIQALPMDWHANYELVKIIHKRWFWGDD